MSINVPALQDLPVTPVRIVTGPVTASEPWPVGYTMTVWGVAIGVTVVIALAITTWLRLAPQSRAIAIQTLVWRLSPAQLLALRSVAQVSGTPASVLLISRGAFQTAMAAWAQADGGTRVTPRRRTSLATVAARVFGQHHF